MNEKESADGFQPGQTVMLKSGGPGMTVVDVGRYSDAVWCRWSDGAEMKQEHFPSATIKLDVRPVGFLGK